MMSFGLFRHAATRMAIATGLTLLALSSAAQESVRPEVGKPLQAAQDMMKAQRFKEALGKVREADAVANKTAYETYLIERMRGTAASGARENDVAIKAFEVVVASGKAPAADQLKIIEALAGANYAAKDYASAIKWANRYFKEGGTSGSARIMLLQSYYLSGDYANATKEVLSDIQADEKAGRVPGEDKLLLLQDCYNKLKDSKGYVATIEKLLNYYPKKSLWASVIARLQKKSGFSDRLLLDVYRLQLATGNLSATSDFMEMAQLALQAGHPAEAKNVVDAAYAAGSFGKGPEADRQKRLRDLTEKQLAENLKMLANPQTEADAKAAKEGNALVTLGYNLVVNGQGPKGISLMEEGIRKGGLKRPEDAKLHLGIAYILAGQKAKATQILGTVQGVDGVSDLAHLWVIHARG
jgi:tetratricopeptide (TPR) repeat protein